MARKPNITDMDVMEYIDNINMSPQQKILLKKKIKAHETAIHVRAKISSLMHARMLTKYLGQHERENYFKQEMQRVRDEGINMHPVKKMQITDI